jgi:hypothetical protein
METENRNMQANDFPADSILRTIAERDIELACCLSEKFGGTSQYIQQLDSIKRKGRNRAIMKRARKLELHPNIALSVGLSPSHTKKIIHAELRRPFLELLSKKHLTEGDEYE